MHFPDRRSVVFVAVLTLPWLAVAKGQEADAYPITRGSGAHPVSAEEESLDRAAFERWLAGPISLLLTVEESEMAGQTRSPEEQAAFRQWFWARRDPSPGTVRNEFRQEFYDRLSYADKAFGDLKAGKAGWSTARGKISLLLGMPTSISGIGNARILPSRSVRDLTIWTYGHDPKDRGWLQIPLVETPAGVAVVADRRTKRAPASLVEALKDAVLSAIHHPDLSFGSRPAPAQFVPPLPLRGAMGISQNGLEGELSLPLTKLYGQAEADGMRITLNLTFGATAPGAGVAAPEGGQEVTYGAIVFRLSREQLSRWSKRDLRVAFWLPYDPINGGSPPADLVVTEGATGRHASVLLASKRIELADHYATEEILSVAVLSGGKGLAIAFIEADGSRGRGAGHLWLARRSSQIEGEVLPLSSEGLRLVRPVDSDDVVSR